MSTYLVTFIISNYEGNLNSEQNFGVYANPKYLNDTDYALDFGQKTLKMLGDYLNSSYYDNGMEKLDLAAVSLLRSEAMENWGLLH